MSQLPLVVGVDAGATTTRCVLATVGGEILAQASGAGANRWSSGDDWAGEPLRVVESALAGVQPTRVVGGLFGVAGAGEFQEHGPTGENFASQRCEMPSRADQHHERQREFLLSWWRTRGLGGMPRLVGDAIVGYAAGSAEPEGLLLLSGTGAAAAWVRNFALHRRCDGAGWLLGDNGSAVWLGRAALQAVIAALDGRGPNTGLVAAVAQQLGLPEHRGRKLAEALIEDTYRRIPAELGRWAPLVSSLATDGDSVAMQIATQAADLLFHSLVAVAPQNSSSVPIVLAGSILTTDTPVAERVVRRIREELGCEPQFARNPAAGAAALAIHSLAGPPLEIHQAHTRLIAI